MLDVHAVSSGGSLTNLANISTIAIGDNSVVQGVPLRPDAVLVTNYLMTIGLMSAAEEIGLRCPEDFALISFDDYPWSGCFRPRLTTIELPKYELGDTAVRLLMERIQGKSTTPQTVNLSPQLRVRESCGFMLHARKDATENRGEKEK